MAHRRLLLLPLLTLAASCSSPPSPPSLDGAPRRPANSMIAVELQQCRAALQDTRALALEAGRLAEGSLASLAETVVQKRHPSPVGRAAGNRVYTLRFAFGSSRLEFAPGADAWLVKQALAADLVVLRGRTDGDVDVASESRMARDRALAVRDYLVSAGVEPARIRATYQPVGDHVADNGSASGRALNRRVEIEIYPAAPVATAWPASLTAGVPLASGETGELP